MEWPLLYYLNGIVPVRLNESIKLIVIIIFHPINLTYPTYKHTECMKCNLCHGLFKLFIIEKTLKFRSHLM